MITFRPDTSFPYLALARRLDLSYAYILWVADEIERGNPGSGRTTDNVRAVMNGEHVRRQIVAGVIDTAEGWLRHPKYYHVEVIDRRGWEGKDWNEKITETEFLHRLQMCKVISTRAE